MDKSKEKRLAIWAIILITVGFVASFVLPEHSMSHFFELLKDIITNLII